MRFQMKQPLLCSFLNDGRKSKKKNLLLDCASFKYLSNVLINFLLNKDISTVNPVNPTGG